MWHVYHRNNYLKYSPFGNILLLGTSIVDNMHHAADKLASTCKELKEFIYKVCVTISNHDHLQS